MPLWWVFLSIPMKRIDKNVLSEEHGSYLRCLLCGFQNHPDLIHRFTCFSVCSALRVLFEDAYTRGISSSNFLLSEFKYSDVTEVILSSNIQFPLKASCSLFLSSQVLIWLHLNCAAFEVSALMFPSALFSLISNLKHCQINITYTSPTVWKLFQSVAWIFCFLTCHIVSASFCDSDSAV